MVVRLLEHLQLGPVHVVGHDTGEAVALILAIEHSRFVDRLVMSNSVCYDRFDDDMLDFGHPMRWKDRPISDLVAAIEESLSMGLSNPDQLTTDFREAMTSGV